jgi:hypothetical protein
MLVAGHQPNYLPWLGFFHKLAAADQFMIVDTAQFVKRGSFGWIHRNKLRTHEGWQWLSLPVKTAGKRLQSCAEAELDNRYDWRRKHWASIEFNYRKAPHFAAYAPAIEAVYRREWTHLSPLAIELIRVVALMLEITTPIAVASEHSVRGESTGLVTAVCAHYGSRQYLSGIHGHDYLDGEELAGSQVAVSYQQFAHPVYAQCQPGEFQPGMCVLDLIFNAGPAARGLLLGFAAAS